MKNNFIEKLKFGEDGEKIINEYLINNNRTTICMYQFDPKETPKLFNIIGGIISPDIISFTSNESIFVECKRKNHWVTNYNPYTKRETGIDTRLWASYRNLIKQTNQTLEIYFIQEEESPVGIYKLTITPEKLERMIRIGESEMLYRQSQMIQNGKPKNMIFFPYESLEKINHNIK